MDDKEFNALLDEAIDNLAGDNVHKGAEVLEDVARLWAKAGLPQKNFMEIRQHIINEAIEKTDPLFINEKLRIAEKHLREKRNGTCIVLQ